MKQRRLLGLLALMVTLIGLRWWAPPRGEVGNAAAELVVAVVRAEHAPGRPVEAASIGEPARSPSSEIRDQVGDAFAVRIIRPPPPPPAPPTPAISKVVAFNGPLQPPPSPPPPPPPPPPLQVIGTWDDGAAPGVFVSTAQGTVLVRPGAVLLAEYRVTAITAQQVSITHVATKHVWQLPVPRATTNR
ncbi:MAG: hypothetical protein ABI605_13415 [Rhizobacter sp.]